MGSVTEESKQGTIYLQEDVSGELEKVLASSKHSTVDAFLEYLCDLYTKASKTTKCVKVRNDVAQRFTSLQCETRFQTSNDLMKHLIHLHTEHTKTASIQKPKENPEGHAPRKSRKSQPKRNFKHTEVIDSDDESGDQMTISSQEDLWRDVSGSSIDGSEESMKLQEDMDLSVVKKESTETGAEAKSQKLSKDTSKMGPMCLTLHKPALARDAPANSTARANINRIAEQALANQTSIERAAKRSRQYAAPNWRRSETVANNVSVMNQKPGRVSVRTGLQANEPFSIKSEVDMPEGLESGDPSYNESFINDEDRESYNYVLDLASSPGPDSSQSNSLPESPMQVPVKYPKSISYTISSDEDEPQDLSVGVGGVETNKPHLSVTKPQLQNASTKEPDNLIKYDSNANALPVGQYPNGAFMSPTQIAIPQNLLFHDPSTVTNLVGQPQVLTMNHSGSSSVSALSSGTGTQAVAGNPPPLFIAGSPPVQLVRGPPPLTSPVMIPPNLTSPNGKFAPPPQHSLVTASSMLVSAVGNNATPQLVAGNESSDGGPNSNNSSPQRRKRKRVEDTTVFRDPQEASLPFNGPNKYRFYCDVCDTGFTRKYTFNRHKCKGRVEKHYCQLCDKAYLSKYKLKDHILVKHEGQTVSCPECGKKFSSRSSMEMHKKQQHEGMFSIFCKICGKGFNHTGHYYGHMNKHTNTKPFWCQQCGKRFYGSSYLHNHKQVCRGNSDLNFSCSVCDRKFKCELYLKKHMKIHDSTPIIANPDVAKATDEDLTKAGVQVAGSPAINGAVFPDQPVFPNGPDASDSNSNSNSGALQIDESSKMDVDSSSGGQSATEQPLTA